MSEEMKWNKEDRCYEHKIGFYQEKNMFKRIIGRLFGAWSILIGYPVVTYVNHRLPIWNHYDKITIRYYAKPKEGEKTDENSSHG